MTDHPDPLLQSLFSEARQELPDEELTARVMARTKKLGYLRMTAWVSAGLLLLVGAWLLFAIPLFEFAVLIARGLTMSLVELGEGWLALVLMPVNNIASLLVISAKAIRIFQKKITGAVGGW